MQMAEIMHQSIGSFWCYLQILTGFNANQVVRGLSEPVTVRQHYINPIDWELNIYSHEISWLIRIQKSSLLNVSPHCITLKNDLIIAH